MAFKDTWSVSTWTYNDVTKTVSQHTNASTTHLFTILGAGIDGNAGNDPFTKVRLKKTDVSTAIIVWQFGIRIAAGSKGYNVSQPAELWYTTPIPRTRTLGRMTVLRHGQGR